MSCRDDDSHLIERVASEFNQLQFYVTQSQGHPLVESIRGVSHSHLHLFLRWDFCIVIFSSFVLSVLSYHSKNKIKKNFSGENLKQDSPLLLTIIFTSFVCISVGLTL